MGDAAPGGRTGLSAFLPRLVMKFTGHGPGQGPTDPSTPSSIGGLPSSAASRTTSFIHPGSSPLAIAGVVGGSPRTFGSALASPAYRAKSSSVLRRSIDISRMTPGSSRSSRGPSPTQDSTFDCHSSADGVDSPRSPHGSAVDGAIVVESLAAYVPRQVWDHYARLPQPMPLESPSEARFWGFVMIADVCGFSSFVVQLEQSYDQGPFQTSRMLCRYFGAMMNVIRKYGGDVIKLAGDALIVLWPVDGDSPPATGDATDPRSPPTPAAMSGVSTWTGINSPGSSALEGGMDRPRSRSKNVQAEAAVLCGLELLKLEQEIEGVLLRMHIALDCGQCVGMHIGAGDRWEYLLGGEFFIQLGPLLDCSKPGELVISASCVESLDGTGGHLRAHIAQVAGTPGAPAGAVRVESLAPSRGASLGELGARSSASLQDALTGLDLAAWPQSGEHDRSAGGSVAGGSRRSVDTPHTRRVAAVEGCVRSYLPTAVLEHVDAKQHALLAENRQVSVVFLRLPELGRASLRFAQRVMECLLVVLKTHGGMLRQILTDDKGSVAILVWGCPGCSSVDAPLRAALAALELCNLIEAVRMQESIGTMAPGALPVLPLGLGRLSRSPSMISRVEVCAGVTTGRAYCGNVGSNDRCEYCVVGNVVNLAARLMNQAHTRGIRVLCDQTTALFVARKAAPTPDDARATAAVGAAFEVRVKGLAAPMLVSELRLGAAMGIDPALAEGDGVNGGVSLLGRSAELLALQAAAFRLVHNPTGPLWSHAVALAAAPGLGKTALLREFAAWASSLPTAPVVLWTRSEEIDPDSPWRGFHTAWLHRFAEIASTQLPDRLQPYAGLVQGVCPGFDRPQSTEARGVDGEARLRLTLDVALHALEVGLGGRPALMLVDQAHNLDALSLKLLAEAKKRLPVLLVVAFAPGAGRSALPAFLAEVSAATVALAPFGPADVQVLLRECLRCSAVPPAVAALIESLAGGNPLYVRELAALLLKGEYVDVGADGTCVLLRDPREGGALLSGAGTLDLEALVTSRIDRCSVAARAAIKAAAVLDKQFDLPLVAHCLRELTGEMVGRASLAEVARELCEDDLWARCDPRDSEGGEGGAARGTNGSSLDPGASYTSGGWQQTYRFAHSVIREVIYSVTLPEAQRVTLHRAALSALERRMQGAEAGASQAGSVGGAGGRRVSEPVATVPTEGRTSECLADLAEDAPPDTAADGSSIGDSTDYDSPSGAFEEIATTAELAFHAQGGEMYLKAASYWQIGAGSALKDFSLVAAAELAAKGLACVDLVADVPRRLTEASSAGHGRRSRQSIEMARKSIETVTSDASNVAAVVPAVVVPLRLALLRVGGDAAFLQDRPLDALPLLTGALAAVCLAVPSEEDIDEALAAEEAMLDVLRTDESAAGGLAEWLAATMDLGAGSPAGNGSVLDDGIGWADPAETAPPRDGALFLAPYGGILPAYYRLPPALQVELLKVLYRLCHIYYYQMARTRDAQWAALVSVNLAMLLHSTPGYDAVAAPALARSLGVAAMVVRSAELARMALLAAENPRAGPANRAHALFHVGSYLLGSGALEDAERLLQSAAGASLELGDETNFTHAQSTLIIQLFLMGRLRNALQLSVELRVWGEKVGNSRASSWGMLNEMRVLLAVGDRDGALALRPAVHAMWLHCRAMGMTHVALSLQGLLVWCYIIQNEWGSAAAEMVSMLPHALHNPLSITSSFSLLGTLHAMLNIDDAKTPIPGRVIVADIAAGLRSLEELADMYPVFAPRKHTIAGILHRLKGEALQARDCLLGAVETAATMNMVFEQALAYWELRRFSPDGMASLAHALAIFRGNGSQRAERRCIAALTNPTHWAVDSIVLRSS